MEEKGRKGGGGKGGGAEQSTRCDDGGLEGMWLRRRRGGEGNKDTWVQISPERVKTSVRNTPDPDVETQL